jgi:hypothetical protein
MALTTNRSTITTVVLDAVQQDQHWKAYVGNVTGTLKLQDAANSTIYDWGLSTIIGEVYASRSNSLSFTSPVCANASVIGAEQTALNMTTTGVDNIGNTFNSTNHTPRIVAGVTLSGCNMTSLYVSNVSQGQTNASDFQEFLMQDATASLVFVSILNDNKAGYNGRTYDFQMIVPESDTQAPKTYYFYIELG